MTVQQTPTLLLGVLQGSSTGTFWHLMLCRLHVVLTAVSFFTMSMADAIGSRSLQIISDSRTMARTQSGITLGQWLCQQLPANVQDVMQHCNRNEYDLGRLVRSMSSRIQACLANGDDFIHY